MGIEIGSRTVDGGCEGSRTCSCYVQMNNEETDSSSSDKESN
jgi:hypothetical protein